MPINQTWRPERASDRERLMRRTPHKINWPWAVCLSLVGIAAGTACYQAAAMATFQNRFHNAVEFVESLRLDQPKGIEVDDWSEAVTITTTTISNVCSYESKEISDIIITDIVSLARRPSKDSLETLFAVWRSLHRNCGPDDEAYLVKLYSHLR